MKLNCDLGEGHDDIDEALFPNIDQANIACGGHAGSPESMFRCVALAKKYRVEVGAHPSYPDRENFGRVSMAVSLADLKSSLKEQIVSLSTCCIHHQIPLSYVKPHGALYGDMAKNLALFNVILDVIDEISIKGDEEPISLMVPGGVLQYTFLENAKTKQVPLIFEGFADRAYQKDGSLLPRSQVDSVYTRPQKVLQQVAQFVEKSGVESHDNHWISMAVDSLCIHSDTQGAVLLAKDIKHYLRCD